jgi:hypothetical protein
MRLINITKLSPLEILMSISGTIFVINIFLVATLVFELMPNSLCLNYLGCNGGFFGFDAYRHLYSGMVVGFIILWFFLIHRKSTFFPLSISKQILFMIIAASIFCILWEAGEYIQDRIRIAFFDPTAVVNNRLSQPSVADTIGDSIFSLLGYLSALGIARFADPYIGRK